jgi:hypothetical protein
MPRRQIAAIPAAPRKTLLEWIDDGDTTGTQPACSPKDQALHACIPFDDRGGPAEPLQPPPGLRLAPLG